MNITSIPASLVTLILLCACVVQAQTPSDPLAASRNPEPRQRVLIIADNQEHLLTGVPLESNSAFYEVYVTSVARRSPLANVGGRLLLKEALKFGKEQHAGLVLHLGDATDISCPDELSSVFNALDEEAKDIWFFTPGNHDGIQVGNYVKWQPPIDFDISKHPSVYTGPPLKELKDAEEGWLNACLSPTNSKDPARADVLTKGDAIRLYLARLKSRPGAVLEKLEPEEITVEGTDVTCEVEKVTIRAQGYTYTAIASICRRMPVNGGTTWVGPYASFIVQRLDVGATKIIMLDTSDYENPKLRNVAFSGDLSEAQKKRAKSLFEGEKRENVIVVGHHPLKVVKEHARRWIVERGGRYMSAHAHVAANLIKHRVEDWRTAELNFGSTLDYPPQAVIADVGPTAMSFRVAGADISKTKWAGFLEPCEVKENRKKWRLPSRFYKDYRRGFYPKHLLTSLEAAVKVAPPSASVEIPSGNQVSDWLVLDRALQTISAAEGESRTFWACQAYYASEATRGEKSWWEELPKLGFGFQSGKKMAGEWRTFTAP